MDYELKKFSLRLPKDMHEWLTLSANKRGISMNAMIIMALETYMQQQVMMPHLGDLLEELKKHNDQK